MILKWKTSITGAGASLINHLRFKVSEKTSFIIHYDFIYCIAKYHPIISSNISHFNWDNNEIQCSLLWHAPHHVTLNVKSIISYRDRYLAYVAYLLAARSSLISSKPFPFSFWFSFHLVFWHTCTSSSQCEEIRVWVQ